MGTRFKWRQPKPTRTHLNGYSFSEFKTLLRRMGYRIPRDWKYGVTTHKNMNRYFRFRWFPAYGDDPTNFVFKVDISEPFDEFDRWANSTESIVPVSEFLYPVGVKSRA